MKTCTVSQLKEAIGRGDCRVVDVREAPEFEAEHIAGAVLKSLSGMDEKSVKDLAGVPGGVVLVCRGGGRASQAAEKLSRWGVCEPVVLQGGMNAWVQAGSPTEKGISRVWELERQVRFTAGSLVLVGVILGFSVHSNFFYLSGFVGAGLVFAAVTNTCGMAMVLARMPWNRARNSQASCRSKT